MYKFASDLVSGHLAAEASVYGVETAVFSSFRHLDITRKLLSEAGISLGSQGMSVVYDASGHRVDYDADGAATVGELVDSGCKYSIFGHWRCSFNTEDPIKVINDNLIKLRFNNNAKSISPVVCLGRDWQGCHIYDLRVLAGQASVVFRNMGSALARHSVIVYQLSDPSEDLEQTNKALATIRASVIPNFGRLVSEEVRIVVSSPSLDRIGEYVGMPGNDGVLINCDGQPPITASFLKVVEAFAPSKRS
jgi:triosephosphate isomerase